MSLTWILVIALGVGFQFCGIWCYLASDRYRKSLGIVAAQQRATHLTLILPLTEPTETLPVYSAAAPVAVVVVIDQDPNISSRTDQFTRTSCDIAVNGTSSAARETFVAVVEVPASPLTDTLSSNEPLDPSPPGYSPPPAVSSSSS
ncbi:hypothetical protein BGZ83_007098 [Gryganskiella cystojenkinii]|nr:hypothetical protein BGZ83_007098 [Gryganskiella cystojenkinii]